MNFKTIVILSIAFISGCKNETIKVIETYPTGEEKKIVCSYSNDRSRYLTIKFYNNGDTLSIAQCESNFLDGDFIEYYPSKRIKEISTFKRGLYQDTVLRFYDQNNSPLKERLIFNNSEGLGVGEEFFPDGTIKGNYSYFNTQKHGRFQEFYHFGIVKKYGRYYYGKLDGEYGEFYDKYHDSIITLINGAPSVVAVSTHLMFFRNYHNDTVIFERKYDTTRQVISSVGNLVIPLNDSNQAKVGTSFYKKWATVVPLQSKSSYLITSDELEYSEVLLQDNDSLYVQWKYAPQEVGEFQFKLLVHNQDSNHVFLDSSLFTLKVK